MKNSERIKIMTDRELAEFANAFPCPPEITSGQCRHDCIECWLDWLKKEANNE